ncbi:hypothetical protein DYD21_19610 [Rhodohalobacter sp. SW132]|nr:hypothetical protein DYD21_19610 [Rhodohalobacter sp. SW132]
MQFSWVDFSNIFNLHQYNELPRGRAREVSTKKPYLFSQYKAYFWSVPLLSFSDPEGQGIKSLMIQTVVLKIPFLSHFIETKL